MEMELDLARAQKEMPRVVIHRPSAMTAGGCRESRGFPWAQDIPSDLRKAFQELQNPRPLRGCGFSARKREQTQTFSVTFGLAQLFARIPATGAPLRRSPIAEIIALPFFQRNAAVEAADPTVVGVFLKVSDALRHFLQFSKTLVVIRENLGENLAENPII